MWLHLRYLCKSRVGLSRVCACVWILSRRVDANKAKGGFVLRGEIVDSSDEKAAASIRGQPVRIPCFMQTPDTSVQFNIEIVNNIRLYFDLRTVCVIYMVDKCVILLFCFYLNCTWTQLLLLLLFPQILSRLK